MRSHADPAGEPLVIENRVVRVEIEPATGAWTGFIDRANGENLLVGPPHRALIGASVPAPADSAAIRRAVESGTALSLEGQWLYAQAPKGGGERAGFPRGAYRDGDWTPTPVPSARGRGDDRLHDRAGDFWYRREFAIPAAWADRKTTLLIGAVDDFDVTYVNGVQVGATGAETPNHWESPRRYVVPAKLLHADRPNTILIKVTNGAYDGGITGPVAIGTSAALRPSESPGPSLIFHAFHRSAAGSSLELTTRSDGWEYRLQYTLPARRPWVVRQLTVRNVGDAPRVLNATNLATPPIRVGAEQAAIFPGSIPVGDNPVARIPDGGVIAPRSQDPLAALWSESRRRGVGAWFHCEAEYSPVSIQRVGEGAEIRHVQQIVAPLKPGESVALGTQYLWLIHGSRDDVLRGIQPVYASIGLRPPAHSLPGLAEKVLYCGHPGGTPEMHFRGYGGFKKLQAYLPTLRKLGIDLLWLLPIWEHGDGIRWNLYSPFDHFKVSPLYGTPEDLEDLSNACAQNGIRLIFDLVPHGPPDTTPLAKEHPDWACRNPDGSIHYEWGQVSFDFENPAWRDYMRRAAAFDAEQYGAVGARVDVAAGSPINWQPAPGKRPSESTLGGGLSMDRAIRQGFLQVHGDALLIPEEYTGANVFYRDADLTYDAQLFFLMVDLQARNAKPGEWARSFQTFLHDQSLALPPGALKMRWVSNHDTVSWTFQAKRPAVVYGVGRMRALEALCALIDGVPMLYQGDEDPAVYGVDGPSNVDFLSRVYQLRRREPALRRGTCDTASVQATGGVFACLRGAGSRQALVLISFSDTAVRSTVRFRRPLAVGTWTDRLSGEQVNLDGAARVQMAPYQARVFTR